jgi:NAD(P)-dependent dehydrogenase (short-subunit alcohol dehydrogenase family)
MLGYRTERIEVSMRHNQHDQKVALVTGASRGIGFATVTEFLAKGFFVWAAYRRENEALVELQKVYPKTLQLVQLDLANSASISQAVATLKSAPVLGEFILINNAGVSGGGPFEMLTEEHWQELFNINLFGLINITRSLLSLIRKTKGRIINIGSISGHVASPFMSSYTGTKFALRGVTDSLRRELAHFDVKVVLIEPGPIKTDIWNTSLERTHKDLNAAPNSELSQVYGSAIKAFERALNKTAQQACEVHHVVRKIYLAATLPSPKALYFAGKRSGLKILLATLMPTKVMDRLLGGQTRQK